MSSLPDDRLEPPDARTVRRRTEQFIAGYMMAAYGICSLLRALVVEEPGTWFLPPSWLDSQEARFLFGAVACLAGTFQRVWWLAFAGLSELASAAVSSLPQSAELLHWPAALRGLTLTLLGVGLAWNAHRIRPGQPSSW